MSTLTLAQTQALVELSKLFYTFLPGSGAIFTWQNVAENNSVGSFWRGGSKQPAITHLMEATYEHRPDRFCPLIVMAVREGMKYRSKRNEPVTLQEIQRVNELLKKLKFQIPDLNDPVFLRDLPTSATPTGATNTPSNEIKRADIARLHAQFLNVLSIADARARGFALEKFLNDFFSEHGMNPKASFKLGGEQIDGSFTLNGDVYLLEARWREEPANAADLMVLRGKSEKSEWTRGLFLSMNGFSALAIDSLKTGKKANLIGIDGEDLILVLERRWTLQDAILAKLRHTGETGEFFIRLAVIPR